MYYLIYQITNVLNNKIYIGAHVTSDLNDGYMGSGIGIKRAISKYGIDNFKKDILHILESKEIMYLKEKELVNEEFIKRKDTYNAKVGGYGGYSATDKESWKKNISIAQKKRFSDGAVVWNRGMKLSDESRENMSIKKKGKYLGKQNPMYGKACHYKMTDDEKKNWSNNIKLGNTGKVRTSEHKKNYSSAASKRKWLVHKDGSVSHTMDENDYRFSHPDWQRGKKWK